MSGSANCINLKNPSNNNCLEDGGLAAVPVGDRNWRLGRPGRRDKLSHILEKNLFCDITFRVGVAEGGELIEAHRLVLSMYSSVFEAMFHGNLSSPLGDIIHLPDIEPSSFRFMLKFIYTGIFSKDLSTEEALGVLYAAKKYEITDLELVCGDFLKNVVQMENAVSIFQTAQLLDVVDLREDVHAFLIRNFDRVSKTEDFLTISRENLCLFLRDDETRGSELEMFLGAVRWGAAECQRQGLVQSSENHRKVLEGVLDLVRFPIMGKEDIALEVVPKGVLTPEECTLLFQHLVVPESQRGNFPALPYNAKKRNCSIYTASFYEEIAKTPYVDISAGWFNKFSVNHPISIVSFGFYGPHSADQASYEVSMKLIKDSDATNQPLAEVSKISVVAKTREIFHIRFPAAVSILPGCSYRAWFSLKGPLTCHGVASSTTQTKLVPVDFTRYGEVEFTYQITGAHQLPEICFQI